MSWRTGARCPMAGTQKKTCVPLSPPAASCAVSLNSRPVSAASHPQIPPRNPFHLQIPVTAFLENDPASTVALWERAKRLVQAGRKRPLSRTAEHVRGVLDRAVCEQPPPSLSEIAQRLDYRGVERLYQVDADLCKRIAVKYRQSGR